jgi:hypothetical protein
LSASVSAEIRVPFFFHKDVLRARLNELRIAEHEEQQMRLTQCRIMRKVCKKLGL